jgi:CRP-like cAMP-binding protein
MTIEPDLDGFAEPPDDGAGASSTNRSRIGPPSVEPGRIGAGLNVKSPNAAAGAGMRTPLTPPSGNRLLQNLPMAELDELRPHLTRVRLVNDQVLLERGQTPEHVFFIEGGLASLVAETPHGQSGVQVAMIGCEGMVGGLALLDGGTETYASAVMQIPGPAQRIGTDRLRSCLNDCPTLRRASLRFIQSLTRQIMGVAACNARNTLTERCVTWLLMADERMGGDDLPVTHEAMSLMLGLRRSGVTVAVAALHKAGLIRTSRGRIRIMDRPGLEAIASGGLRVAPDGDVVPRRPLDEQPRMAAEAGLPQRPQSIDPAHIDAPRQDTPPGEDAV